MGDNTPQHNGTLYLQQFHPLGALHGSLDIEATLQCT